MPPAGRSTTPSTARLRYLSKMSSGRNAETVKLGTSTTWLILRLTATLESAVGLLATEAVGVADVVDHIDQRVCWPRHSDPPIRCVHLCGMELDRWSRRNGGRDAEAEAEAFIRRIDLLAPARLAFVHIETGDESRRRLHRRSAAFAIALREVRISGRKKRARHVYRQVQSRSGGQLFDVEVPAVLARRNGA